MAAAESITCTVNGETFTRSVEPRRHLAEFLRQDLGMAGTHVGCEHGACGEVLIDGQPARSCLLFAAQADGLAITTVEGSAAADGTLLPLQQAFWDHHGLQCGFCTPLTTNYADYLLPSAPEPAIGASRRIDVLKSGVL
jgi:aerobic carbon-monoxide dehydrogenase small subunit